MENEYDGLSSEELVDKLNERDITLSERDTKIEEDTTKIVELGGIIQKSKRIVKDKKREDENKPEDFSSEDIVKQVTAEMQTTEFYKNNPELVDFTNDIKAYTDTGLSIEDAKHMVTTRNETYLEQVKANSMNISVGIGDTSKKTISRSDLENKSQSEYNTIKDMEAKGEITITQ